MKKHFIVASTFLVASASLWAATESSDVAVVIENQAITLANIEGLNFGTILPFGRNGTVTVNANGQAFANDAHLANTAAVSASQWEVTGVPGAPFSVVLPANNTVTVSSTNGETMTVTNFTRGGSTLLDAAGNGAFNVGARLNVGANQPAGTYTGTFDVTVAYN